MAFRQEPLLAGMPCHHVPILLEKDKDVCPTNPYDPPPHGKIPAAERTAAAPRCQEFGSILLDTLHANYQEHLADLYLLCLK